MDNNNYMIQFQSDMTKVEHKNVMKNLLDDYKEKTEKINKKINEIIPLIHSCNPLDLMDYLFTKNLFGNKNMTSEFNYTKDQILSERIIEYVHSILVSKFEASVGEGNAIQNNNLSDETVFNKISENVSEIYEEVDLWYLNWFAYAKEELKIPRDELDYIIESQSYSQVRGHRYHVHQKDYLKTMFLPINDLLFNTFNITSQEFINGLSKIEYSITQGKFDALKDLYTIYESKDDETMSVPEKRKEDLFSKVFGTSLYDVKAITNWSDEIIQSLSFKVNETDFFNHEEYPFWPIVSLPLQQKPFIEIEGISYCFSYYNLFDNIYRMIQKLLTRTDKVNIDKWQETQKKSSEKAVTDIFQELLPKSEIYQDNYYPIGKSLKNMNENDIIIVYENTLIVVEVKAGSFTPDPAITNYQSHLRSYESLFQKGSMQCQRTIEYLKGNEEAIIYSQDKKIKKIFNMQNYTNIYLMCVNIDFLDVFAAKAEKISGINIELGTIVLSVDDLRVYQDFFESPFIFLNYLKNRSAATKVEQLKLNDELDHLGMYIFNNMYSKIFSEQKKDSTVQAYGYREELDKYFAGLQMEIPVEKPQRPLNKATMKLLELLDKGALKNKVIFSDFLLDFSSEGEEKFIDSIFDLYDKQNELGRRVPAFFSGKDLLFILSVRQENLQEVSVESEHKYVDCILAFKKIDSAMWINVEMNSDKEFISLEFEKRFLSNIPKEKLAHYEDLGQKSFEVRKQKFLNMMGKRKIGRNSLCLCGSGLKYKRCCGK